MSIPCGPHEKATGHKPVVCFFWSLVPLHRTIALIDGFNLYHAIASLRRPELKWVNLKTLSGIFINTSIEQLDEVFYFTAYADHVAAPVLQAQKAYIKALKIASVLPILGFFKKKERKCPSCSHKWVSHEEKETDVNIASYLIDLAYQNVFDRALVISNDSDLSPAIRLVRRRFPEKRITTVAPPNYYHSNELIQASSDKARIRPEHLEQALFPSAIEDGVGHLINCPKEYTAAAVYAET
ncbi:MAG TPA: NYN domain-containing protein [Rhabdochlamydiaceae bacterium]|nr:NYN domain-containing protein [Rhabdochlamydiaceae bacterium]